MSDQQRQIAQLKSTIKANEEQLLEMSRQLSSLQAEKLKLEDSQDQAQQTIQTLQSQSSRDLSPLAISSPGGFSASSSSSPIDTLKQLAKLKRESRLKGEEVDDLNRVVAYLRGELTEKKKELNDSKQKEAKTAEQAKQLMKVASRAKFLELEKNQLESKLKEKQEQLVNTNTWLKHERKDSRAQTISAQKESAKLKERIAALEKELEEKKEAEKKREELEETKAESVGLPALSESSIRFGAQSEVLPEGRSIFSEKQKVSPDYKREETIQQLTAELQALHALLVRVKPDLPDQEILSQAPSLAPLSRRQSKLEMNEPEEVIQPEDVSVREEEEEIKSEEEIRYFNLRKPPSRLERLRRLAKRNQESLVIVGACVAGGGLVAILAGVGRVLWR